MQTSPERRTGVILQIFKHSGKGILSVDVAKETPYVLRFYLRDCNFEPQLGDEVAFYIMGYRATSIEKLKAPCPVYYPEDRTAYWVRKPGHVTEFHSLSSYIRRKPK